MKTEADGEPEQLALQEIEGVAEGLHARRPRWRCSSWRCRCPRGRGSATKRTRSGSFRRLCPRRISGPRQLPAPQALKRFPEHRSPLLVIFEHVEGRARRREKHRVALAALAIAAATASSRVPACTCRYPLNIFENYSVDSPMSTSDRDLPVQARLEPRVIVALGAAAQDEHARPRRLLSAVSTAFTVVALESLMNSRPWNAPTRSMRCSRPGKDTRRRRDRVIIRGRCPSSSRCERPRGWPPWRSARCAAP